MPDSILEEVKSNYISHYEGAITSGSGGGYVVVASEKEVPGAIKIKVRY